MVIPAAEPDDAQDSDNSEWNLTSEEAEASSPGALFYDPALSANPEISQIPDVGDMETQIPVELPHVEHMLVAADAPEDSPEVPYQISDIPKYIIHKDKKIMVTELQWDKANTMGQIRSLSTSLVKHYVRSLKKAPPRKLIRILAKATSGL